jgi:glucokinase
MVSIGIDIGGTKMAAGVVTADGEIVERSLQPSPILSARQAEDAIVEVVARLSQRHRVDAVGVGAAGWVDSQQTTIRFSPHLAWRDEPIALRLAQRVDRPVIVDNDANAAAWAEFNFGAGRGAQTMIMLTLGTGIGGAMVSDGRLFRGGFGMAGEWGHSAIVPGGQDCPCGSQGCWEQYASGHALARRATVLTASGDPRAAGLADQPQPLSGAAVGRLALAGDPAATDLVAELGDWLGLGLANLAAGLDPEVFIIGGGLAQLGDLLLEPARAAYRRHLSGRGHRPWAVVRPASFGNDAGLIGAAALAQAAADRRDDRPTAVTALWSREAG